MLIEERPLKHWIDHFYGYGSWHAKIWFVAYEESGGDLPEDVAERLNYFNKIHVSNPHASLCDVRDLCKHVTARLEGNKAGQYGTLYDYRFGSHAMLHGIWKNLIAFAHGYNGKKLPDLLDYQKKRFLSPSAAIEALINLYPLPSPHNHAWYYSWLDIPAFSFLKSRTVYQEQLFEKRLHTILNYIKAYKPEVVLMYGMDNINTIKDSMRDFFPDAKFKMIKAIKRQIPQHHQADLDGTMMLITTQIPSLRHNRVETGFDWHELGRMKARKG
jgi:hypothetical protein